MAEIARYQPELERLTDEYWKYTKEEQGHAVDYIQAAINRGKVLGRIKASCERGEWAKWCINNDVDRATAWRYMQLAEGEETLLRFVRSENKPKPDISVRQALAYLEREREHEREAKELQDNIIRTTNAQLKAFVAMREFLERNPDVEFDIDPEFVFKIDEAKIALDNLNERLRYED